MDLIFVHGALVRDGDWWWRPTAELFERRTAIRSIALALPSCGEAGPAAVSGGLVADAAALREALDGADEAIVVGHSYGGTVIAEAGAHPAVARLVYVSSYLPDEGLPQGALLADEADPVSIGDNGDGTLALAGYDEASFAARFMQDADAATAREAWRRVTAQAASAFTTPTSAAGWRGVDSTYIVCAQDRSTSVGLQRRHAGRATRKVELPTGHHPFITRPDLVVAAIRAVI